MQFANTSLPNQVCQPCKFANYEYQGLGSAGIDEGETYPTGLGRRKYALGVWLVQLG